MGDQQNQQTFENVAPNVAIVLEFSDAVDEASARNNIALKHEELPVSCDYEFLQEKKVSVTPKGGFKVLSSYKLIVNPGVKSTSGTLLSNGKVCMIKTGMDDTDKFERIPDEDLLTLVQKQTFKYFWDFGHEYSGMARERTTSGDVVTTGGTGFGVMAMLVAAERGFITRQQAVERVQKIVTFLDKECTAYHGAYAHWINGATGATKPFSEKDNGADLVETSLLFQGLLAARAYFKENTEVESRLRADITRLWEAIDWTWFRKNGEDVLYWHWSPDYGFEKNLAIRGWNECLITYILAASSPTHAIDKVVYEAGWAKNGGIRNGKSYYGITLPLGSDKGGPLFLSQYSFLGINPQGLEDQYADYWMQNRNHTLINYNYCKENPKGYTGYSASCWGLTASDGDTGYSAHSPTNDKGVIAPTAALSAFPYTPEESMEALHFFYYKMGDKLWKDYGFIDAFNLTADWYDTQYIAIDQGPIICMIENYRTGLLWNLFMSIPEIQQGLKKLGFQSPCLTKRMIMMRILIYLILLLYPFNLISGQKKQKRLSDDELMTLVQKQTFRYFWDFAHPESGLAHERSNGGAETATIGGSGFGVMAIIVGIERGFITREQGAERILKIVRFLSDKNTDSYHGMWAHWMNGKTGKTIPFSRKDDGADIVESAFMFEGLLAAHQYFTKDNPTENRIRGIINNLWRQAEWNLFYSGTRCDVLALVTL